MLNDRQLKILDALITDYILTGEPISSRTIAKKHDLGISSATIRNEMSDIEEMGFILQPHTSSGRIPSDKGYRLHVDNILTPKELSDEEAGFLHHIILSNINHMESLMKETARAVSLLTNYTTVVSEVGLTEISIQHVQLIPIDQNNILIVIVTIAKVIKNSIINVPSAPSVELLNEFTKILNSLLFDLSLKEIKLIKLEQGPHTSFLEHVLESIIKILTAEQEIELFTSGVNNILAYPEFSDVNKAQSIFKTLEEKECLITLLDKKTSDNIQVVIGSENSLQQMKDCSIIKASFSIGQKPLGAIGIIGPTRMDYQTTFSVLNAAINNLHKVLNNIKEHK